MTQRLRWWWRVLVALAAGLVVLLAWGFLTPVFVGSRRLPDWVFIANMVSSVLVSDAASLTIYHKLTYMRFPCVGETRCRKCGYILRGLTAPRCPECGEQI